MYEVKEEEESGERLHFVKFETKFIETCLDFIQQNLSSEPGSTEKNRALKVTGNYIYYYQKFSTVTNSVMAKVFFLITFADL